MRFMRLTEVIKDTGLGRSSIYKRIAEGEFPKPVPLGLSLIHISEPTRRS